MIEVYNGLLEQSDAPTIKVLFLDASGNPVPGLIFSDVTLRYLRKPDTSFNAFALSGANFIELSDGIYKITLDGTVLAYVGELLLYFSGGLFENFTYRQTVQSKNPGNVQVTITVETVTPEPLPDTQVDIWDNGQTILLWSGVTDSSGQVVVALNPGSYKVLLRRTRTSFTVPETLTVIGPSAETKTYNGTEISIPASSNPDVCVVYGYVYDITGVPDDQISPDYIALTAQRTPGLIHLSGRFITVDESDVRVSDSGYFEIELIRGLQVKLEAPRFGLYKTITVPNQATVDLSTLV